MIPFFYYLTEGIFGLCFYHLTLVLATSFLFSSFPWIFICWEMRSGLLELGLSKNTIVLRRLGKLKLSGHEFYKFTFWENVEQQNLRVCFYLVFQIVWVPPHDCGCLFVGGRRFWWDGMMRRLSLPPFSHEWPNEMHPKNVPRERRRRICFWSGSSRSGWLVAPLRALHSRPAGPERPLTGNTMDRLTKTRGSRVMADGATSLQESNKVEQLDLSQAVELDLPSKTIGDYTIHTICGHKYTPEGL